MVVVPGAEGDIGVLPGHAPLISNVRPGIIAVFENNKVAQRIFVAGGFAEVTPERCTVLAEAATMLEDIDRAAVEVEMRNAREDWPMRRTMRRATGWSRRSPSAKPRSRS
jgi:F-type H+-transporting ATPase subunit epsilon